MFFTRSNNNCANEKREMRLEAFLVLQLLLGFGLSNACFLIGCSLHAWHFWASFAAVTGLAFWYSRKAGLWMIGLNFLMLLLTFYTFTYVHVDASICHLPISHFLEDGWNPVTESSVEAVRARFAGRGVSEAKDFLAYHIIAAPKFSQILAAQMQSAFGLFSAGGYALWFMCFALAISGYRFSTSVFRAGRRTSAVFAALLCSNTIIAEACFSGLVDYVAYSAIAIAAMSLRMWLDTKSRIDLYMFFGCAVVAVATKMNSLACVALLLISAAVIGRKEKDMRFGLLVFLAALAFFCVIPYWASAWRYGSPFYPAHSFRADVPTMDLTSDFIGNEDANRMGYVARMVYAWVSKPLAVWGCRIWYSVDGFDPQWKWEFLSGGQGWMFSLVLWSGALLSLFINRNRTTLIAWILLLAFLLVPVKYIGYSRYANFVFFVIAVLWFNIVFSLPARMRQAAISVLAVFALNQAYVCASTFLRQVRDEGIRQRNIDTVAEFRDYRFEKPLDNWEYVVKNRFPPDGASPSFEGTNAVDVSWPLVFTGPRLLERDDSVYWSQTDGFPSPVWSSSCFKEGGGR